MNLKLVHKLNIVHLLHFAFVLLIALAVNLLVLSKTMTIKLSYALAANSENVNDAIDNELEDIENIAALLSNHTSLEKFKDSSFVNSISHDLVQGIHIIDGFDTSKLHLGWNYSKIDSVQVCCLLSQHSGGKYINITLGQFWLDSILNNIQHDPNFNYLIINQKQEMLYSTEQKKVNIVEKLRFYAEANVLDSIVESKNRSGLFGKVNLINARKSKMAYAVENSRLNFYFITYFQSTFLGYMRNYSKLILFELFIILTLMTIMIIRTNIRITKPITVIVNNLKDSKYITLSNFPTNDESKIIQRTIDTLQSQIGIYANRVNKSQAESAKLEKDIQIAKRLQRNILPHSVHEIEIQKTFKIYAISEAAYELGGDLYDYFMLDANHMLFVVADIAGKGIPASLFMIFTHTLLRSIAKPEMNVADIAEQLNNKLIEENVSDLFVTMFLGILNTETGKLNYCNAAHNMPLIVSAQGVIEELSDIHGIPIGIYPNRNYKSSELQLNENDQIVIFTDGVVDSKDENEMNFTVEVLKYNLMGAWFNDPKEVVEKLNKHINNFRGNKIPEDDMTILALKYTPGNNVM